MPNFHGICVDTGAEQSVAGLEQTQAYLSMAGKSWNRTQSNCFFKFGDTVYPSIGFIPIRIPTPHGTVMEFNLNVVEANVPIILGLDLLDKEQLYIDNIDNILVHKHHGWSLPLQRKRGHLYITWNYKDILYTKRELQRLHLHFYHPTAKKLYNLVSRATPGQATPDTMTLINKITEACKTCQRFSMRPKSFQVTLPGDIVFNYEVAIDLMFINRIPILHVVDTQTAFSSAEILTKQNTDSIGNAFLMCWSSIYAGYPDKLRVDSGSVFTSRRWKDITNMVGIQLKISGVESHNSLGSGEKYHSPLRRIFLKVKDTYPHLDNKIILKLSVKSMNDTMGPHGLVPSLLVFGILPRFPISNTGLPDQRDRMKAMQVARAEMETYVAEERIKLAIRKNIPASALYNFTAGDLVLIYRELGKNTANWTGPYKILRVEDKNIFIDRQGEEVKHSVHQAKPFIKAGTDEILYNLCVALRPASSTAENLKEALLTRVIPIASPEMNSPRFNNAKRKEITGLQEKGVWEIIDRDQVPRDANVLNGRFVLSIKNEGTTEEKEKARFVVQGHKDKEKNFLVHNSNTSKQASTRLIASISSLFNFTIWTCDVSQAYTQSKDQLSRDVFLKPPSEFYDSSKYMLKLKKPLYGLTDAGDYWNHTDRQHITHDLQMVSTYSDPALYYKKNGEDLMGLRASYVDDSLLAGTKPFQELSKLSTTKFQSRAPEFLPTKFAGIHISKQDGVIQLSQEEYINQITLLPNNCSFSEYRSLRATLQWICHSRPDICCATSMAAQVSDDKFKSDYVDLINKAVKHLKQTPERFLNYPQLDITSLRLKAYSDAAFANNEDFKSQIGCLILLCDRNNRCHILSYSSTKCKRVTRSILGGELCALADAFDKGFTIKTDLERMLNKRIPLSMFTDSKSLFDIITKCSSTTEKRLMIDIRSVQEGYETQEISDMGLVRSEFNPADCLTKVAHNQVMESIMNLNYLQHPVEQWVFRKSH